MNALRAWIFLLAMAVVTEVVAEISPALSVYDPLVPSGAAADPVDLVFRDEVRNRDLPLRVYLPVSEAPAPVILFSHGLGGSRTGSAFLGQHWAGRGYAVVFLQHPGSDESVWRDVPPERRVAAMQRAGNLRNFGLRVGDVPAVIDQLERWQAEPGHALAGRLDLDRLGMSGHSFGAITTQAVSGQVTPDGRARFTDPRIDAAVIMSPSVPRRGDSAQAFGSVRIPWLLMTGTEDIARLGNTTLGTADIADRTGVFPLLPAGDKYQVVLFEAEHSAFTERALPGERGQRNPNHHVAILALSTAFWDAHLRNDPAALAWLNGDGPRQVLDAADDWQTK